MGRDLKALVVLGVVHDMGRVVLDEDHYIIADNCPPTMEIPSMLTTEGRNALYLILNRKASGLNALQVAMSEPYNKMVFNEYKIFTRYLGWALSNLDQPKSVQKAVVGKIREYLLTDLMTHVIKREIIKHHARHQSYTL